jgi:hypothetical protein
MLMHDRVFFVPQLHKLVTLGNTGDQLYSREVDVISAMNRAGVDYLFIESVPPLLARPGRAYRYQIKVRSRAGEIKFTLDSGPEGMSLSKDGLLSWDVPVGVERGQRGVIITVEDASGRLLLHTFTIRIENAVSSSK